MFYIKSYLIAIVVFFSVDLVWLGAVAKNLYREQLGFLLKDNFNMTAAAVFYIFYIAGLLFFCNK
ncbi:DUF2177 family protein [Halanaerobium sp.]|jgi:uncharacterized membrane protein|uniref:DUF2177 family protein n=1 Tax=Halanaerobium sp. TaxID=1895664 RepID=UPI000DE627D7|nr:DUF2177 family protein [Halanaerobium sp.]PUU87565.1 MAG: hypothetical protein CI949_3485 [Halanaerobium sp.]